VNAPTDREVQLGDITNFAVTAYLAELTDSPRSVPGFTVIAVARPDESRVNVTCQPNDIAKLVSDCRDKLLFGNLVVLSSAVLHFTRDDGDKRYLVDQEMLEEATARLRGTLLDPLKSTVVHERRTMGTWVVRKGG
jgi:hypothetical protein